VGLCVDRNASDSVSRRAAVWLVDIDKWNSGPIRDAK
jgi:hypothetical protein